MPLCPLAATTISATTVHAVAYHGFCVAFKIGVYQEKACSLRFIQRGLIILLDRGKLLFDFVKLYLKLPMSNSRVVSLNLCALAKLL